MMLRALVVALSCMLAIGSGHAQESDGRITRTWAFAEFGTPLYGSDMRHWPYANPDAPKGGTVTLATYGGFDSFNTLIARGEWQNTNIGLVQDTLMVGSEDEIGSYYGLIAESVEFPEDKSWAVFTIRPEARFHDGHPITAEDFKYAFDLLKEHGRPFLRAIYEPVQSAEFLDDRRIKFTFSTRGQMKPIALVASLNPEPKHWWSEKGRDPSKTTLEPPLGSGAYRLAEVDPGRKLVYERVPDYWGRDLPVNRGLHNFDRIVYDFYRDQEVMFEAFKGGAYAFRGEGSELRWSRGYDFPAVKDGRVIKRAVPVAPPRGVQAYFINTRRPHLADPRVREALNHIYDFETIQRTLLFGLNQRSETYFVNSEYSARGVPEGKELELLEPHRTKLPARLFTEPFRLPRTDGSGSIRENLRKALALFKEAGWTLKGGKLVNANGEPFRVEILIVTQDSERWTLPYAENLRRAGIEAKVTRLPDTATWERRADEFDFDLFTATYTFFPPPGTELVSRFASAEADVKGSANLTGIKDPVVDALLDTIVKATDHETLLAAARALDRVLLWGWYIVPHWHRTEAWIAHKNIFGYPERTPRYAVGFINSWWIKPDAQQSR